jgi:hypothetical protein
VCSFSDYIFHYHFTHTNSKTKSSQEYMRAICKVHGLTLLLEVGTSWRCSDGLVFKVPPLASNALLRILHPRLVNMLQTVDHFETSRLRAPFSCLEKPRNHMWQDQDCMTNILLCCYINIQQCLCTNNTVVLLHKDQSHRLV